MRARFTDSIASTEGWSFVAGTEVSVGGDQFAEAAVPKSIAAKWLATGLLEPIAPVLETATTPRPTQGTSRR